MGHRSHASENPGVWGRALGARRSLPLPPASSARTSRISRSTWKEPFLAGTYSSVRSLKAINPVLSLLRWAARAMQAQNSAAVSRTVRTPPR